MPELAKAAPKRRLLRRSPAAPPASAPAAVAQAIRSPARGQRLHPEVRRPLAHSLGVDLDEVRVHTDPGAAAAARAMSARAFAYGTDVYLGEGERADDRSLIAHEVAHVVQQQGEGAPQPGGGLEDEAAQVSTAASRGEPAAVQGRTGGAKVQGWSFTGWLEDKVWDALEEVAPVLVPIMRRGFFNWLTDKLSEALEAIFDTVMRPIRAVTGLVEKLATHFTNLVQWIKEAATGIARGDCSAITAAAKKIGDVLSGLAAPIIEQVREWAGRVKDFFVGVWDRFGAPAWEFLQKVGGAVWETIKDVASWIWDLTEPIREWLGRAWRWIKKKLGIGGGTEGKGGILQWVKDKAAAAWDWVKSKLEPYKKVLVAVGVAIFVVTGGPIFTVVALGAGLIYGIRWISQHMSRKGSVVDQRSVLERDVIPKIMGAVTTVGNELSRIAKKLTGAFGGVLSSLGKAVGMLAGSILSFLVSVVEWVANAFKKLLQWAIDGVQALAGFVISVLEKLKAFLEPILAVVRWIGAVVADILNLVSGVIKKIWNKIPACIKDPVVSFLINQILRRIPIFSKLLEVKDIWQKLKDTAIGVIRAIFVHWDIKAAVLKFFKLILDILEVPLELVQSIYAKARNAFSEIVKDPLGFLRNTLRAAWEGFGLFFGNIATHLWNGLIEWFRTQMKKASIELPTEWSFRAILSMIFSIAGVSVEKLFEILEKKLKDKPLVARIRKFYKLLTGVWEWVSITLEQGVTGLWAKIQQTAGDLWDALMGALVGWVTKQIVNSASPRLLAALNPIGAIINAILAAWAAIKTAAEYAKQILEMVNTVLDAALDLARGATSKAAGFVEKALAAAVPIAVGFLANFLRLGNLGERVKEMLKPVQDKVEAAIGSIIDAALSAGRAMLDKLGLTAKEDLPFEAAGQHHHLWVDGEIEDTAKVMVASDEEKEYDDRLTDFSGRINDEVARAEDKAAARTAVAAGRKKLREWRAARGAKRTPLLVELKGYMQDLYTLMGHPEVPKTIVGFEAGKVWAKPLTRKAGDITGDESTSKFLHNRQQKSLNLVLNIWRALHMLSARLHGPNKAWNFILGSQAANTKMYDEAEKPTLEALEKGKGNAVLWYETAVTPWPAPDNYSTQKLVVRFGEWDPKMAKEVTTTSVPVESVQPSLTIGAIDINESYGREVIEDIAFGEVPGAEGTARSIVELREARPTKRFDDWPAFEKAVDDAGTLRAAKKTILELVSAAKAANRLTLK